MSKRHPWFGRRRRWPIAVIACVFVAGCQDATPSRAPSTSPDSLTPAASATAPASASPTASPTVPAAPSPSPSLVVAPGGTASAWTKLNVQKLTNAPAVVSVTPWSGGYLGLGTTGDTGTLPLHAWTSVDGRTWVPIPDVFGPASQFAAARSGAGLIVATITVSGVGHVWHSADAVTWTLAAAPPLRFSRDGDIAGNANGTAAVIEGAPHRLAFRPDGETWHTVSLPGRASTSVAAVAAFRGGFVAVGESGGRNERPVAWWSPDGRTWSSAAVAARPGDAFLDVAAGASGLVAFSTTAGYTPGTASFWSSSDGRTWKLARDPLGIVSEGEGTGSANGLFIGNGARLLGFGTRGTNQVTEYWTSTNATEWTKLALSGDVAGVLKPDAVTPTLLPDGVLFTGPTGMWFGTPTR